MEKTDKMFKGARVYRNTGVVLTGSGFRELGDNLFVMEKEIDDESDSEINTDESDTDESLSDFIVPDDETSLQKPPDAAIVDQKWREWHPTSAGAKRFKDRIDKIEEHVKAYVDDKFAF